MVRTAPQARGYSVNDELAIGPKGAEKKYADLDCTGKLTRAGSSKSYVFFVEIITKGRAEKGGRCPDGTITVARQGDGRAVAWFGSIEGKTIVDSGSAHPGIGSGGVVKMRTSTDGGYTWTNSTTIISTAGEDLRVGAAGVAPNGRIVVSYARYDNSSGTFLGSAYLYSDNGGSDWSNAAALSAGGFPYGKIIEIGNGELMMHTYSANAPHAIKSTDNGETWSTSRTDALTASSTMQYTEASFAYLGGGQIVGLVRENGGNTFRQTYSSDTGATWTDEGDTSFDSWSTTGPAWLEVFDSISGRMVRAYYQNRTEKKIRSIDASVDDITKSGANAWNTNSRADIASFTDNLSGYPSFITPQRNGYGIGSYYDEKSSSDADISIFIGPFENSVTGRTSFLGNVGIGTTTPNNKLNIFSSTKAALGFSTNSGLSNWTIGQDAADSYKFKISSSTALGVNDRFVIDGRGNIGIGTTSPYSRLHIWDDATGQTFGESADYLLIQSSRNTDWIATIESQRNNSSNEKLLRLVSDTSAGSSNNLR